jgi:RND family efflux transporter MFP subunit
MKAILRHVLPALVLLVLGAVGMVGLMGSSDSEEKNDPVETALAVSTVTASSGTLSASIRGSGVVQAARLVDIVPQVNGRIDRVSDRMKPGGRFSRGELLASIESADYELAIASEKSRLRQAEVNLQLERERMQAAQREWELLGREGTAPALASRQPQVDVAEAQVEAAQAGLDRAELSLGRTRLLAPFNSMVRMESIEIGQVVGAGAPIASLVGTDLFWVRVSVPVARLSEIEVPGVNAEQGSSAEILFSPSDGVELRREGQVLHLEGELDAQSRTATLLVGIEDPMSGEGLPLLLGAYVDVRIGGKEVAGAFSLPALCIRNGDHVLVADSEDRLARKEISLGWLDGETAVVLGGLADGDRVITSPVSIPIYGQSLRLEGQQ